MKIVVASDQAGYELKEAIRDYLEEKGHEVHDVGTYSEESVSYAEFSQRAADKIVDGSCERGFVICGTGIGVSMVANKNPGVRCALCTNAYMAEMARRHNDANVLALGGRVLAVTYALTLVDIFMEQEYDGGRHQIRLDQIAEHERSIFRD
ncbi:MAG: ribose 5-phosphate isomerase B [Clostridiaceae bacterium]|nr:ribose 5-phosphate isomerase B [Clostridiaceae bacterium]